MATENNDPKYIFFDSLVREFNSPLAFMARHDLYLQLEKLRVLGKVFSENARALLRPYLFETSNCKHWHELELIPAHNNDELEEYRVNRFLNDHMDKRFDVDPSEDYELVRQDKAKQLYLLFREMDYRTLLAEKARGVEGTPLGYIPCSTTVLRRIRKTYPSVRVVEELWSVSETDLREKGVRKDTAEKIVVAVKTVVQKNRRKTASTSVAKRLEASESAGQSALFW